MFPPFAKTVGIERLSRILNDYFSSQIALVSNHGGDIIKFAGDALMAMWEENMADTRPLACLRAAQCALELQEQLGGSRTGELGRSSSETRMSVEVASDGTHSEVLNIKISLGYGQVSAFHVSSSEGGANPLFIRNIETYRGIVRTRPSLRSWPRALGRSVASECGGNSSCQAHLSSKSPWPNTKRILEM